MSEIELPAVLSQPLFPSLGPMSIHIIELVLCLVHTTDLVYLQSVHVMLPAVSLALCVVHLGGSVCVCLE